MRILLSTLLLATAASAFAQARPAAATAVLLRNAVDDHTKPVFDPAIGGKTDQMVVRFKKPA